MSEYVPFTKEMKEDYTILVPTMLPMHFKMIIGILRSCGYHAEVLEQSGREITECGLKYVHNDTCYPALLVIGQFITALQSGKYDPQKTALMLTQTGGGCRASNYISLTRKALAKAGFGYIPVISLNTVGLEKHPGFKLSISMIVKMLYAVTYGDLLMSLRNQCRPYECTAGESDALAEKWTHTLTEQMSAGGRALTNAAVKRNCTQIVREFAALPKTNEKKVLVGVVGEIFVKFSPLGNNNLEELLLSEGAQVVMPGLMDFLFYCVYNNILDKELYGLKKIKNTVVRFAYNYLLKRQAEQIAIIRENSDFLTPTPFGHIVELAAGFIGLGAKMGEGWLLTAEMLELIEDGVTNIVCAQPFGCLPNHIVGKGMMKPIKERNPGVNIVAIDYDPSASAINQENRLKLMLATARENYANQAQAPC